MLAGQVRVGVGDSGRTDRKPGDLLDPDAPVELLERERYVSRGGHKLEAALDAFGLDPAGLNCLDVGASTGGFTDVLLQRGAESVVAVDVGRGQLADRLRRDPRVHSIERTNARSLGPELIGRPVRLAVVDVSFISLALVLGPIASCFVPEGGPIVALVKPQFEAGRGQTDAGVVRDPVVHRRVLEQVAGDAASLGLTLRGAIASPLQGPAGNREFLFRLEVAPTTAAGDESQPGDARNATLAMSRGDRPRPMPLDERWLAVFDELARR